MSQDKASKIHPNGSGPERQPDPEVVARAKRRTFSAAYKQRILAEVDQCDESGQVGALLRREGLYSSHLTTWRRQRADGQLTGLSSKRRGRKKDEQAAELAALRQENERLRAQLTQAELIIGNTSWGSDDKITRDIFEDLAQEVAQSEEYQHAKANSGRQNAKIAFEKMLIKAVQKYIFTRTDFYRDFTNQPEVKSYIVNELFRYDYDGFG